MDITISDKFGSKMSFDQNWRSRKESRYNHWVQGRPVNQVQLAFRNHWELFSELLGHIEGGRCLEIGCGRGTISSYFVENGFDCVLLDFSKSVLDTARNIFDTNSHDAEFVNGDAVALPFKDNYFDAVVSIGLLEHFEDIKTPIAEQIRVLRQGGIFLGYIVPERKDNVQRYFHGINATLKLFTLLLKSKGSEAVKRTGFRSDYCSHRYMDALKGHAVKNIKVFGMYPLPMISHSPDFPFSLLPHVLEFSLTRIFEFALGIRRRLFSRNPWICEESFGQAFLLTFKRK